MDNVTQLVVEAAVVGGSGYIVARTGIHAEEYLVRRSGGRFGVGVARGWATEFATRVAAEAAIRSYQAEERAGAVDPGSRDPNTLVRRELAARRAAVEGR